MRASAIPSLLNLILGEPRTLDNFKNYSGGKEMWSQQSSWMSDQADTLRKWDLHNKWLTSNVQEFYITAAANCF